MHWNTDLFSSFAEAVDRDKGLVVIGVFLDIGEKENNELEKITRMMSMIKYKNQKAIINDKINIEELFPKGKFYLIEGLILTNKLYFQFTYLHTKCDQKCRTILTKAH